MNFDWTKKRHQIRQAAKRFSESFESETTMNLDQAANDISVSCGLSAEFQGAGDTPPAPAPSPGFLQKLIALFTKLAPLCALFGAPGDSAQQLAQKNFNAATGEYHPDFLMSATAHTMRLDRKDAKHHHRPRMSQDQSRRTTIETLDKGRLGDESDVAGIVVEASQVDLSDLA